MDGPHREVVLKWECRVWVSKLFLGGVALAWARFLAQSWLSNSITANNLDWEFGEVTDFVFSSHSHSFILCNIT
jgi:hypothetical protein